MWRGDVSESELICVQRDLSRKWGVEAACVEKGGLHPHNRHLFARAFAQCRPNSITPTPSTASDPCISRWVGGSGGWTLYPIVAFGGCITPAVCALVLHTAVLCARVPVPTRRGASCRRPCLIIFSQGPRQSSSAYLSPRRSYCSISR